MTTQTTERLTEAERKDLARMVRKTAKLLGQITFPWDRKFLSEEHRAAQMAALKAFELFDKLAEQYPVKGSLLAKSTELLPWLPSRWANFTEKEGNRKKRSL